MVNGYPALAYMLYYEIVLKWLKSNTSINTKTQWQNDATEEWTYVSEQNCSFLWTDHFTNDRKSNRICEIINIFRKLELVSFCLELEFHNFAVSFNHNGGRLLNSSQMTYSQLEVFCICHKNLSWGFLPRRSLQIFSWTKNPTDISALDLIDKNN